MRFLSRPASGTTSGSTLSASQEPPGRKRRQPQLPGQARARSARPGCRRRASAWRRQKQGGMLGAVTACAESERAAPERRQGRDGMIPAMNRRQLWRDLSHFPWGNTAAVLGERFREDRLGLTASSLTFTTTIAMVPFFTVALALFTVFPMFSKMQGRAAALADRKPDPRQHRAAGAGLPQPVREQGQRPGRRRPGGAAGNRGRADPDHRQDAQQHLARAHAAAVRAAGADLLGRDHARAAGAGR